jgi:hypothetical protein
MSSVEVRVCRIVLYGLWSDETVSRKRESERIIAERIGKRNCAAESV